MSISSVGASSLLQQMQQALFAKADADGDGQLSSDEFLAIGQNLPSSGNNGPPPAHSGVGGGRQNFSSDTMGSLLSLQQSDDSDRAAKMFASADSDGDGTLTADELAADMAAHAPPGATGDTAAMAADLVAKADADGDGLLSSDEFAALKPRQGGPPPGGPPPSAASGSETTASTDSTTTYDPADTNEDGQVSMSELLASLQTAESSLSGFSDDASDLFAKLLSSLAAGSETASVSLAA